MAEKILANLDDLTASGSGLPDGGSDGQIIKIVSGAVAWADDEGGAVDSVNAQTGTVEIEAPDVPFEPIGGLAATDVAAALAELDSNKFDKSMLDTDGTAAANADDRAPSQQAMREYVTANAAGTYYHPEVKVVVVSGNLATDFENGDVANGHTFVTGERFFYNVTGVTCGVYNCQASGAAVRVTDLDTGAEFANAVIPVVGDGTVDNNTLWVIATPQPITVGVTSIQFSKMPGPGAPSAGDGIAIVGDEIAADFGDSAAHIAGTSAVLVTNPVGAADAVKSFEFPVDRTLIGWTADPVLQIAANTARWAGQPLDFIADLGAVGDNLSPVADTGAWQEWAAAAIWRGCGLNIPAGTYRITENVVLDGLRNLKMQGHGGGNPSSPGSCLVFEGTDLNGFFYMKSCIGMILRDLSFVLDAPGIDYHGIIGANADPELSSITHIFDNVGFGATTGNYPVGACLWIRNAQEITFINPSFTQAQIALRLGDIDNVEGGQALGGVGRVILINPYICGDINIQLAAGLEIIGGLLGENHAGLVGSKIYMHSADAVLEGLRISSMELAGDLSGSGSTATAIDLQEGTYNGISVQNNRVSAYRYACVIDGAGDGVLFENNKLNQNANWVATNPVGLLIQPLYTGRAKYWGNKMTTAMVSNSGVEAYDDRSQTAQIAALDGVETKLGSNVTMSIGATTTVLASNSIRTDGSLYEITATVSVINPSASVSAAFWLEYDAVEIPGTRAFHLLAAGEASVIPFHTVAKCGPASVSSFRIRGFQASGTAIVVRAASAAQNGQTHISARRRNV